MMVHGMSNVINIGFKVLQPLTMFVGLLEVDSDPLAERIVVLDRLSLTSLVNSKLDGGIFKVILPFEYTTKNNLLVGILDSDMEFNATFLDGVRLQVIDSIEVDIKA